MKPIRKTFVLVAADCPVERGTEPPARGANPTVARIQYELLTTRPYTLRLEHLILAVHVRRAGISEVEAARNAEAIRAELFAKPHPCMRASPLPKSYGWGVHHDEEGRIAIVGVESDEYARFARGEIEGVDVVLAMRNKRA
ncbi:DUF6157 family protein [Planctomyces sp. SH-PL62]|uniref:DUF6157 family protein n=1 Tax=Planctomyces sp. SH-PL62 TaxID=1636152 RepID=UPI00078E1018|nr:DUF6157 family protein [Planctomyces sp. SH-PL62]AMV36470.1 hypothetical protein VT85_03495 [Planctomyces sp. SH-PL62]